MARERRKCRSRVLRPGIVSSRSPRARCMAGQRGLPVTAAPRHNFGTGALPLLMPHKSCARASFGSGSSSVKLAGCDRDPWPGPHSVGVPSSVWHGQIPWGAPSVGSSSYESTRYAFSPIISGASAGPLTHALPSSRRRPRGGLTANRSPSAVARPVRRRAGGCSHGAVMCRRRARQLVQFPTAETGAGPVGERCASPSGYVPCS